ncbi:MAG TPA: futalosine hydrolase [Hanamia sp.]|nr:futalosine hydrolase [Hanamia sp.]
MNVLIVAATKFEIEPFLKENNQAEILITGIGIPSTIFRLTKKLLEKNYDLVINAGIAGSFEKRFSLSEVVLVKEDTFGDIGIDEDENFRTLFETGLANENDFPNSHSWLINQNAGLEKWQLPFAKGITINKITDDILQIQKLQQKFSADIESMEGAAFHYVCLQQKINFLQVRSISNTVGERDKTKWQMKPAIANLNKELLKMISKL